MLLPVSLVQPFVGVLLWCWISFMNPHRLVWGGIALVTPWAAAIAVATFMGCLVAREPKRFPVNALTILIIVFLILITITLPFALAPWQLVWLKYTTTFKSFLFLLMIAALLTSHERVHALVWIMVMSLAYFGIKGGAFTIIGGGVNTVLGPPSTMIADNNHLALGLLVSVPLMNYLRTESPHPLIRFGLAASIVLTLIAVLGSHSRGALLAIGAVAFYYWCKSSRKLVTAMVVIVAVGGVVTFMPQNWKDRMMTIEHYEKDKSAMGRLEIWHTAWVMARSRPLVGGGFDATYTQAVVNRFTPGTGWRAVHSIWFETLGETGFPTFSVWLGMLIAGAVYARRIVKMASGVAELRWCVNLAKMSQVSMIAFVTGGTFLSLEYWDFYFTILVAVAAVHSMVKAKVQQEQQPALAMVPWRARLALSQ